MKILLVLLSILVFPGAIRGVSGSFLVLIHNEEIFHPFIAGIALFIVLYYLLLKKWYSLQVFDHELTHAVVALLFLRKITSFRSSSQGGYVGHSGGFGGELGNMFITLAPYFFPTFTLLTCSLRPLVPVNWFPWYDLLIGATLGYHFASTIDDIKLNYTNRTFFRVGTNISTSTDISKTGFITSTIAIIAFTILVHAIIFYMLTGGYSAVWSLFEIVFSHGMLLLSSVKNWIVSTIF